MDYVLFRQNIYIIYFNSNNIFLHTFILVHTCILRYGNGSHNSCRGAFILPNAHFMNAAKHWYALSNRIINMRCGNNINEHNTVIYNSWMSTSLWLVSPKRPLRYVWSKFHCRLKADTVVCTCMGGPAGYPADPRLPTSLVLHTHVGCTVPRRRSTNNSPYTLLQ